jgi:hypothetical protein
MISQLFRLNLKDLSKGLVVSVLGAVLAFGAAILQAPGFSFAAIDWAGLIKVALGAGLAYLVKNFISDENGRVLGKIG